MNANSLIEGEVEKLSIGSNVKKYRTARNLTQRELAKITELANSTISDIERDTKPPSVKVLRRLSKALHCTEDNLLND